MHSLARNAKNAPESTICGALRKRLTPTGSMLWLIPISIPKYAASQGRPDQSKDREPTPAESDSLQRGHLPGDPQETRFHFCHPALGAEILKSLLTAMLRGLAAAANARGRSKLFRAPCRFQRAASRGRLAVRRWAVSRLARCELPRLTATFQPAAAAQAASSRRHRTQPVLAPPGALEPPPNAAPPHRVPRTPSH